MATILIPTYFGGRMLQTCMDSIFENVKNPKVLVYKNDEGWLKACNRLMKSTTDDVILLNDDTIVLTDIVAEMQKMYMCTEEEIGIIGGKALAPDTRTVINYGVYVGVDGNTGHKHFGEPRESITKIEKQRAVEGSCMYIRRGLLDKIGYFDEGYGMGYREEIDLALRAREAGWGVYSCPTAEYIHFTSQTNARLGIGNSTYEYFMSKWGTKLKLGKV